MLCVFVVVLVGGLGPLAAQTTSSSTEPSAPLADSVGSAPLTIQSLVLRDAPPGGLNLEIAAAAGLPDWTASVDLDNTIHLRLANALAGPAVRKSVRVSHDLVKRIRVTRSDLPTGPGLDIEIRVAEPLAIDIHPGSDFLRAELRRPLLRASDSTVISTATPDTSPSAPSQSESPAVVAGAPDTAAGSSEVDARQPGTEEIPTVRFALNPPVEPYRIGPGDELNVDVFGIVELQRTVKVQSDGRVALPILGRLNLQGKTLEEAESTLAGLLRERGLATNPEVFLSVESYQSQGVFVQGAVVSPGLYQVPGGMRIIELLSAAGGLSQRDPTGQKIMLMREQAGIMNRMEISTENLLARGDLSLNVMVLPGDMVMVPEPRAVQVYVSGAVQRPGPITTSGDALTVLQAITAAGGETPRAKLQEVSVLRRLADGSQETIKVNVKAIRRGREPDFALQDNDTVVVPEWFF